LNFVPTTIVPCESRAEWHSQHMITCSTRYRPCSRFPVALDAACGAPLGPRLASADPTARRQGSGITGTRAHTDEQRTFRILLFSIFLQIAQHRYHRERIDAELTQA
jgi:hypothetical protein